VFKPKREKGCEGADFQFFHHAGAKIMEKKGCESLKKEVI
jgi:hypothetical protein